MKGKLLVSGKQNAWNVYLTILPYFLKKKTKQTQGVPHSLPPQSIHGYVTIDLKYSVESVVSSSEHFDTKVTSRNFLAADGMM